MLRSEGMFSKEIVSHVPAQSFSMVGKKNEF